MNASRLRFAAFHPDRPVQPLDGGAENIPDWEREPLHEPAVCDRCGAVYHQGKWEWMPLPRDAAGARCPACWRINEGRPAACVSIGGTFRMDHHDEIIDMIRGLERRERAVHPLKRIMAVRVERSLLLIDTTDVRMARDIGEALRRTYKGDLRFHFGESAHLVRVHWER